MPPKKKAKISKEPTFDPDLIASILAEGNPEGYSDSDDGGIGYTSSDEGSSFAGASKSVDDDLSALAKELNEQDELDEEMDKHAKKELPGLTQEVLGKLSDSDKQKYAQILNEKLLEKPYHLFQFLDQINRNIRQHHRNPLLTTLDRIYFMNPTTKTRIREILTGKKGGFIPSPISALNAVNPFNQSYIKKLEILNLNGFLSMIGSPTELPGKIKSGVSKLLTANYLAMGKAIINVFAENEELKEKAKELGFELYSIIGDGALFITEKHDEKLKTIIEKTSHIGNFMMIPAKTLGVVVFNILMGVAGTVPGVAAGYRILKLGKKFIDVSGKTMELALRIGTGNWAEFNNFLQLLMEAAVMIPKGIYKFFNIFKLGKQTAVLLASSGSQAINKAMASSESDESVGIGDITGSLGVNDMASSLTSMGSDALDDDEEEDMDMGMDMDGAEFVGDDKEKQDKKKKPNKTKKAKKSNKKKTKKKKKKKKKR